ncbi:MAG: hypothetical protein HC831_21915 [Chloroflexia bacterium]|nr:hypothetical protein [Chloroflexia bacterium]
MRKKNENRKISIVRLQTNSGSANGYKTGIEEAIKQTDCDFIWLLDDDNVPRCDALQVLKRLWTTIEYTKKSELMSLVSFREDRPLYLRAVMENNPKIVLGRKNIYRAFHIADIIRKVIDDLLRKRDNLAPCTAKEYGEIYAAPYGGMFFNKKLHLSKSFFLLLGILLGFLYLFLIFRFRKTLKFNGSSDWQRLMYQQIQNLNQWYLVRSRF